VRQLVNFVRYFGGVIEAVLFDVEEKLVDSFCRGVDR
jgi:hypothetical protein